MALRLEVIVVTGASAGLGRAIVRELAGILLVLIVIGVAAWIGAAR